MDRGVDADRRRCENVFRDPTAVTDLSLRWQTKHGPRRTAANQVIHHFETKMIEPTRGSGAEVSMLIEAVDDYRPQPVENFDRC